MSFLKENKISALVILFFSGMELLWVPSYFLGFSLKQFAVVVVAYLFVFGVGMTWSLRYNFRGWIFSFTNLWAFLKARGWILGYAAILVMVYLYVNRPDGDDEIYLKMQILPMLASDTALKNIPDFCAAGRVLENFEIFQACISSTLKVPFLLIYYTVFPVGFLLILPLIWRRFFLCLGMERKRVFFGLLICLLLMITWADTHRAPANFGLVRMFQGKGVYYSIILPVQFMALMSFYRNRRLGDAFMATLSFYAGMFFTPTAVPCTALMYGVTALVDLRTDWRETFKATFSYILMLSGPVILGLLITSNFAFEANLSRTKGDLHGYQETIHYSDEDQIVYKAGIFDEKLLNTEVVKFTYGLGIKALIAVVSMIYVVFRNRNRFLQWYTILFLGMLFFPLTGDLFSKIYASFSWRWLWCYPIIPVVAWSVTDFLSYIGKKNTFAAIGISILLLISYTSTGRTIFYRANGSHGTRIEFSPIKLFAGKELRYDWYPIIEDYWLIYDGHKL